MLKNAPQEIETIDSFTFVLSNYHNLTNINLVVIYENPTDYPHQFVARLFIGNSPTNILSVKNTLKEIRALIPCDYTRIERFQGDDPVIVETWIK